MECRVRNLEYVIGIQGGSEGISVPRILSDVVLVLRLIGVLLGAHEEHVLTEMG